MYSQNSFGGRSPEANPYIKLKRLQLQHKELEQSFRQKIQSLKLQMSIYSSQFKESQIPDSSITIQNLFEKQAQIRFLFTEQLLQKQIQVQQQTQMREIINNYQKRISDLRVILINKQAEISNNQFQFLRDSITRKQNLQTINNDTIQKSTLKKYIKQRKKIIIEIEALEHTLQGLTSQQKIKSMSKKNDKIQNKLQKQKERILKENKTSISLHLFNNSQKDLLLDRVLSLIQIQLQKQQTQIQEIQDLKTQLQCEQQNNRQFIEEYKELYESKTKSPTKLPSHLSKNSTKSQVIKLNFIEELELQMNKKTPKEPSKDFLHRIDINSVELHATRSKTPKINRVGTSLKQRKKRICKQN